MRTIANLVTVLAIIAAFLAPARVQAQETRDVAVWHGIWNEQPMTVTVIGVNHTIPEEVKRTEPWWQWGNTSTDGYLFSFHNPEETDLAIVFTSEEGRRQAIIYAFGDEEKRKGVQIVEGHLVLPPHTHASAIVSLREGDWLIEGEPTYNLDIREMDENGTPVWESRVGGERPGLPTWITRNLLEDYDPSRGYPRFGAALRSDETVPYEIATPLMPSWPYLSLLTGARFHWGEDRPISFDVAERTLQMNWVGFQIAGLYTVNSMCYAPLTCFESPFAWYRFDSGAERRANMVIRGDVWPESVSFGPPSPNVYRTAMRMSWTAADPSLWRYSLTVAGNHPLDAELIVGDTILNSISYADLPSWLAEHEWKAITFVEATQGEFGSEGIYDYSVEDNYPVASWINGLSVQPPTQSLLPLPTDRSASSSQAQETMASFIAPYLRYPTIHPNRLNAGFRGEYSLAYNRVPGLYVSPVDDRVHLLHAEGGVWNLGDGLVLRTHNLSESPYVEGWTLERLPLDSMRMSEQVVIATKGEVEEQLYSLEGFFIYSGTQGVEVIRPGTSLQPRELVVPTDKRSWQHFLNTGTPDQEYEQDPRDLRSWLRRFSGETLSIPEGQVSGIRATPSGFRFVLTVPQTLRFDQEQLLLGVNSLEAGRYAVTFDRGHGALEVELLTPPALSTSIMDVAARQLEQNPITVTLANDGLEDVPQATLELWATSPQGTTARVATETVALLAQTRSAVTVQWAPPSAGEWALESRLRHLTGPPSTSELVPVLVAPAQAATFASLIITSTTPKTLLLAILALFTATVTASALFLRLGMMPQRGKDE